MLTTLQPPDLLFLILGLCWCGCELLLGHRRRAADGGTHDQGTLRLLWRVLYTAVTVAVLLSMLNVWRDAPALRAPARWLGCALLLGGLALRLWAIRVLARWFTVDLTIQHGQRLVGHGPYRYLRHPSYTGALLAFYGLAVGMGNVLSLLAIVLPVTWVFVHRIRIEETMLTEAFPLDYPAYAAHRWRLLPWVW
ncbi:methyltransferase family protein [Xanthomonas albilineans]|uniref:methyltransferase family protein n=1 Tax=Xanthomonas albilineans TaxID=29447 RepID=UPI0005F308BB|nr:PEMT/PEM2 methyltransferase family protein [Xanthomonas albilineans]